MEFYFYHNTFLLGRTNLNFFIQVWTELQRPDVGAANFFTGMGGFLQTLMFGYAGLGVQLDRLEVTRPQLPAGATRFKIRGWRNLNLNTKKNKKKLRIHFTIPIILEISRCLRHSDRYCSVLGLRPRGFRARKHSLPIAFHWFNNF